MNHDVTPLTEEEKQLRIKYLIPTVLCGLFAWFGVASWAYPPMAIFSILSITLARKAYHVQAYQLPAQASMYLSCFGIVLASLSIFFTYFR